MKIQNSLFLGFALSLQVVSTHALETGKLPDSKAKVKESAELTNTPVDADKLKKEFISSPVFSTQSADQSKSDEAVKKNQEKFEDATIGHVLKLDECGKKYSVEDIKKCKAERFGMKK